jgi:hypothetical protein
MRIALVVSALVATCLASVGCATEVPEEEQPTSTEESPLKTKEHAAISGDLCRAAGINSDFCTRLAAEAFDVDYLEWNNLSAHAMPMLGQSQCDAAAATQARLRGLGAQIHGLLAKTTLYPADKDQLANALGRALHTIQDNCAHEGMNNPQHSWYSNRGWCLSNGEDPDENPAAIECARNETWTVLLAFVQAVQTARYRPSDLSADTNLGSWNPGRDQVCSFLREWQQFDGRDHRWDNTKTAPAFRQTLIEAFRGGQAVADVCTGLTAASGHSPIAVTRPRAPVAVSDPLCFTTKAYCFGE